MTAHLRSHFGRIAIIVVILGAAAGAGGEDLVTGHLEIRGAVLKVSPELQEVAPGLPTIVRTTLGQLEPGQIPTGVGLSLRLGGDIFTTKRRRLGFGHVLLEPRCVDVVGSSCVQ